jgi:hypothetical protein
MNMILKLSGACIACAMLVAGTISANADIGRDDGTAKTASIGTQVALNPQPRGAGAAGPVMAVGIVDGIAASCLRCR